MSRNYDQQRTPSSHTYYLQQSGPSTQTGSYNHGNRSTASAAEPVTAYSQAYSENVSSTLDGTASYNGNHHTGSGQQDDKGNKTGDEIPSPGVVYAVPQRIEPKTSSLTEYKNKCRDFWPNQKRRIEMMTDTELRSMARHMELPMARVKKIMKIDDDVRSQMVSQDAPLVLSAACEFFIQELTLKGWQSVEEGRRKTLQKCDVSAAVSRNEHFDFLIDIVPRDETKKFNVSHSMPSGASNETNGVDNFGQPFVVGDLDQTGHFLNLSNGQVIHATVIGQPIPLNGENALDINQLPPGVQVIDVNQAVGNNHQ